MDLLVAPTTHYQGFASSCCHLFDPDRLLSPSWLFQISEFTDMVHLYLLFRAAEFTCVRKDSLKEFAPVGHDELREVINENGFCFSLERDPPEASHKWFLVLTTPYHYLQAFLRSIYRFNGSVVSLCHLGDGGSMFPCQCL